MFTFWYAKRPIGLCLFLQRVGGDFYSSRYFESGKSQAIAVESNDDDDNDDDADDNDDNDDDDYFLILKDAAVA